MIHVYTDATITEATGYVGNFVTKVKHAGQDHRRYKHGATIIATGADEYKPTEYLYGEDDRVLTQLELEERIAKGNEKVMNSQNSGDDPVRRLPAGRPELLRPDMLQPLHQERLEAERDQSRDGHLRPLPGYEDRMGSGRIITGRRPTSM